MNHPTVPIHLDYGKTKLKLSVLQKNLVKILHIQESGKLPDRDAVLMKKLKHPTGTKSFYDLCAAHKNQTAVIVVSDKTRDVPNHWLLPPLLKTLDSFGLTTTILVATGMHGPTKGKDLVEMLGKPVVDRYRVVNHNANDAASLVTLGKTPEGLDIRINRTYHEAGLKILTGLIEPHLMLGFSGGRKAICPGIASSDMVKYFHGYKFIASKYSTSAVLKNNPCHAFSLKVAKLAGADFLVNVTLNAQKEVTGIFCGDLEKAHLEGAQACADHSVSYLSKPVDIVLTCGGGYPLDRNLYQGIKGMVAAYEIVKPGGTIICAAECRDGIGSEAFQKVLDQVKTLDGFIETLKKRKKALPDQWQAQEFVKVLKKARVKLYTEHLTAKQIAQSHMEAIPSVSRGLSQALAEYGPQATIAVMPSGPYVIARLKK